MMNPAIMRTGSEAYKLLHHQGTNYRHRQFMVHQPIAYFSSTFDSMYSKMVSLPPVHYMEDSLASFHEYTGIPWYGTIILFTAGLRTMISLPAQVTSHKVAAKRTLMFKEISNFLPALRRATDEHIRLKNFPASEAAARFEKAAKTFHRTKVIDYNCHMAKLFLPLYVQIPVWMFNSIAIRNMAMMRASPDRFQVAPVEEWYIQMAAEGALWFPNLTEPDPFFILPLLVGITFATNIFLVSARSKSPDVAVNVSKYQKGFTIFLYSIAGLMVPITAFQPSAVAVYWATSGAVGIITNLIVISPKFRRVVRIPHIPAESSTPYLDIKQKIIKFLHRK
jgi:inner membrane protein COX18